MSSTIPNFRDLYNQPDHSDVKLRFDGETLHAHKAILLGYSDVFKTAFQSKLPVSTSPDYHIEGYPIEVVYAMMKHIYGYPYGMITYASDERTLDFHISVFLIANEYQITSLGSAVTICVVGMLASSKSAHKTIHELELFETIIRKVAELYMSSEVTDLSLLEETVAYCAEEGLNVRKVVEKVLDSLDPFAAYFLRALR